MPKQKTPKDPAQKGLYRKHRSRIGSRFRIEVLEDRTMLNSDPILLTTPSFSYQTIADLASSLSGTSQVTDGSGASNFNRFGNKLVFTADDGYSGTELWSTDGTTTQLIRDINPGSQSSIGVAPHFSFLVWGNKFVFTADDGVHGRELWQSDGTASGTSQVSSIYAAGLPYNSSGVNGSSPRELALSGDGKCVFFSADDGLTGRELWRTDGTIEGTRLVSDIRLGLSSGDPRSMSPYQNGVLFIATDDSGNRSIWFSDGSDAGTYKFGDPSLFPGVSVVSTVRWMKIGAELYAWTTDISARTDLFRISSSGLQEINYDASLLLAEPQFFVQGTSIYFIARDTNAGNTALFRVNLTGTGSSRIKDFTTALTTTSESFSLHEEVNGNRTLSWFRNGQLAGSTFGTRTEVWSTDGSTAGTVKLFSEDNARIDFVSRSAPSSTAHFASTTGKIWQTNATIAGTTLLGNNSSTSFVNARSFATINSTLLFVNSSSTTGAELWSSNLTLATPSVLKDINSKARYTSYAGPGVSDWTEYKDFDKTKSRVFFIADLPGKTRSLMVTSPTATSVYPVKDSTGNPMVNARVLAIYDGFLFFLVNGRLWKTSSLTATSAAAVDAITATQVSSTLVVDTSSTLEHVFLNSNISANRRLFVKDSSFNLWSVPTQSGSPTQLTNGTAALLSANLGVAVVGYPGGINSTGVLYIPVLSNGTWRIFTTSGSPLTQLGTTTFVSFPTVLRYHDGRLLFNGSQTSAAVIDLWEITTVGVSTKLRSNTLAIAMTSSSESATFVNMVARASASSTDRHLFRYQKSGATYSLSQVTGAGSMSALRVISELERSPVNSNEYFFIGRDSGLGEGLYRYNGTTVTRLAGGFTSIADTKAGRLIVKSGADEAGSFGSVDIYHWAIATTGTVDLFHYNTLTAISTRILDTGFSPRATTTDVEFSHTTLVLDGTFLFERKRTGVGREFWVGIGRNAALAAETITGTFTSPTIGTILQGEAFATVGSLIQRSRLTPIIASPLTVSNPVNSTGTLSPIYFWSWNSVDDPTSLFQWTARRSDGATITRNGVKPNFSFSPADYGVWDISLTITDVYGRVSPERLLYQSWVFPEVSFNGSTTANEGDTIQWTATLVAPLAYDIEAPLSFTGNDNDLLALGNGTLRIPAGQTSGSVSFSVVDDPSFEPSDIVSIRLAHNPDTALGRYSFNDNYTVNVTNSDAAPVLSLTSISNSQLQEDVGTIRILAGLSATAGVDTPVTLELSGSASSITDYVLQNATLVIPAGKRHAEFQLKILNDTDAESAETIFIKATTSTLYQFSAANSLAFTISENDASFVSFYSPWQQVADNTNTSVNYNIAAKLTTGAFQNTVVPVQMSGSAILGVDYEIVGGGPAQFVFAAGTRIATLPIRILDVSGDRRLDLTIPETATIKTGVFPQQTLEIQNSLKEITFVGNRSVDVFEDTQNQKVIIEVSSNDHGGLTIPIQFGGSAIANVDYATSGNSVFIPAGQTRGELNVNFLNDSIYPNPFGTETTTLSVTMGQIPNSYRSRIGTQFYRIQNNDPIVFLPVLEVVDVKEGGYVDVKVALSGVSNLPVIVNLSVTPINGTTPNDYSVPAQLVVPAGQTSATYRFTATNDGVADQAALEGVTVELTSLVNGVFSTPYYSRLTSSRFRIIDLQSPPRVYWSESSTSISEGSEINAIAKLTVPSELPVSVNLQYTGSASGNPQRFSGPSRITFAPNQIQATINIRTTDDSVINADRLLTIRLSGAQVSEQNAETTVTIGDNDRPAPKQTATVYNPPGNSTATISTGSLAVSIPDPSESSSVISEISIPKEINKPETNEATKVKDEVYVDSTGSLAIQTEAGYLSNATIFFDLNRNYIADFSDADGDGVRDAGEPEDPVFSTAADGRIYVSIPSGADLDGNGLLDKSEGQWVSSGGLDTSTRLGKVFDFTAPITFQVISSTSTLINALSRESDLSIPDAVKAYLDAFGLAYIKDIEVFEILRSASTGDEELTKFFKVDTQLYVTAQLLAEAIATVEPGYSLRSIARAVFRQLAISATGSNSARIRLSDSVFVNSLVRSLQDSLGVSLTSDLSTAISSALVTANARIEAVSGANASTVNAIVRIQKASLTEMIFNLSQYLSGSIGASQFSTFLQTGFDAAISTAIVGNIVPVYVDIPESQAVEGDNNLAVLIFTAQPYGSSTVPFSLSYATASETALDGVDFTSVSGTLNWNVGDTSPRQIIVPIIGDSILEPGEQLRLVILNATDVALTNKSMLGSITDDDAPGTPKAPSDINISDSSLFENQPTGTTVGDLTAVDFNAADTHTFSLVAGAGDSDNGAFSIVGSQLKTAASFDFETKNSYSIRVRTTDALGLFIEKTFAIDVTNVNDAPTALNLSSTTIAENNLANAVVGTFSTIDPDADNTFTYSLVTGTDSTDNAAFTVSGAQLTANAAFDFETKNSYSIRVRTTDALGLFFEQTFTISVTNINDAIVTQRQVFYNNASGFGTSGANNSPLVNPISAIDPTKQALLPGGTTVLANFTNYSRGLNGIVIDLVGTSNLSGIAASSFQFGTWSDFTSVTPNFLTITPIVTVSSFQGGGVGGSDRVKLVFADQVIQNAWLRITVLANSNTGLVANDTFYFGNARFDVTPTTSFPSQVAINVLDTNIIRARNGTDPNNISSIFDVDKSGSVNVLDTNATRAGNGVNSLRPFTAPLPPASLLMARRSDAAFVDLSWLESFDWGNNRRRSSLRTI